MTTNKPLDFSEDGAVEQPTIKLFGELGWQTMNCYNEFASGKSTLGRESKSEVVLVERLRAAIIKLNPKLPADAVNLAIEEITRDRSAMSITQANRQVYYLLKDGVKVSYRDAKNNQKETIEIVQIIDWKTPENNNFFLASQFWVVGDMYSRRADLIGFVNGLPLVFIELKAGHKNVKNAYDDNLQDYRNNIPQLFVYNAFIILSNGLKSYIGSISAEWEHFAEWKRINEEGEQGAISLETMVLGTCTKERLLDLVENFTLFQSTRSGLIKLVAKNHQYLGVNQAIKPFPNIKSVDGKLGVFWHTQGSGKSVSMILFAQKILRKIPGNWTFLIVTDRQELDTQIYKNFVDVGVITEQYTQASSSQHLKELLQTDHRFIFTLIHKFRADQGTNYPKLTDRSDIIVIADEAHRTQYTSLALNMRNGLPNAAFIAFTGTPLIVGEEKTKDVFGDYVSVYDFKQSTEDGATVPLYYENRIPELQLTNEELNEDIEELLDSAMLDEDQELKIEKEFSKEYHLITREDRLKKVAEDLIIHFANRGYRGKAMVVSIDKATAVRMYDKVQKHKEIYLNKLKNNVETAKGEIKEELIETINYLETTDMAVIVSQSQNEVEEIKKKGADITKHRSRMINKSENLEEKFKDPNDSLRLVFVCAMWMTGFDVQCCSTIYLDKPMRNHTLMQTIARANRVFPEKTNGLIVDYIGVFRDLQKALAIYGSGATGTLEEGESPAQDKSQLVAMLRKAVEKTIDFCNGLKIDFQEVTNTPTKLTNYKYIKWLQDALDAILVNDKTRKEFSQLANQVLRLYKAILPDVAANEFSQTRFFIKLLADAIDSQKLEVDISKVIKELGDLLDNSIAAEGYIIDELTASRLIDLSQLDFEGLKDKFLNSRKNTELAKLRNTLENKLAEMVRLNYSRLDYLKKLEEMINEYNAGSVNVEEQFRRLLEFAKSLHYEEQRTIAEGLTEEELAIFDLLTRPEIKLSKTEESQVKKIAKTLLIKLKEEKLVLDWRKRQQTRANVKLCIETTLDELPESYTAELYKQKCEQTYQHVYEFYYGAGKSAYAA
jgi:type I restriction enzyme, R subunit